MRTLRAHQLLFDNGAQKRWHHKTSSVACSHARYLAKSHTQAGVNGPVSYPGWCQRPSFIPRLVSTAQSHTQAGVNGPVSYPGWCQRPSLIPRLVSTAQSHTQAGVNGPVSYPGWCQRPSLIPRLVSTAQSHTQAGVNGPVSAIGSTISVRDSTLESTYF